MNATKRDWNANEEGMEREKRKGRRREGNERDRRWLRRLFRCLVGRPFSSRALRLASPIPLSFPFSSRVCACRFPRPSLSCRACALSLSHPSPAFAVSQNTAEFIIELAKTAPSVEAFRTMLNEQGADATEALASSLYRLVQKLRPGASAATRPHHAKPGAPDPAQASFAGCGGTHPRHRPRCHLLLRGERMDGSEEGSSVRTRAGWYTTATCTSAGGHHILPHTDFTHINGCTTDNVRKQAREGARTWREGSTASIPGKRREGMRMSEHVSQSSSANETRQQQPARGA